MGCALLSLLRQKKPKDIRYNTMQEELIWALQGFLLNNDIMLIFRFISQVLFGGFNVLALKKHISFIIPSSPAAHYPLCLIWYVLATVSLRPLLLNTRSALIGLLTHAWAGIADNNRAAAANQFLRAKLTARHKLCKCVTREEVRCHKVTELKAGQLMRHFMSYVFCGREERLAFWHNPDNRC